MINSFKPVYVSSLACSLSPYFPCSQERKKNPSFLLFFGCNIPSLGSCSKLHFSAHSPPPQQETQDSGWSAQGCGTDQMCSAYFVLPSTDCLLYSPLIPWRSLSVPAEGIFLSVGTSPCIQLPARVTAPFFDSSFISFILLGCKGIFFLSF